MDAFWVTAFPRRYMPCWAIRPKILVPMHYRGAGFGFDVLSPVEDFLALAKNVRRLDSNVLEPDKLTTPVTAVLRCPVEA